MTNTIHYKDGYQYQLATDYKIQMPEPIRPAFDFDIKLAYVELTLDGLLTIKSGFAWDGATGAIDTKTIMRGSLVHDALCYLINRRAIPLTAQRAADKVLQHICRQDGMNRIRAFWVYRAVRRYDLSGLKPYKTREVKTAP